MQIKYYYMQKFPGGAVVRTLPFQCRGHRVGSLIEELRSHKLRGAVKNKIPNITTCNSITKSYKAKEVTHQSTYCPPPPPPLPTTTNRQNLIMVLEVRLVVTLGKKET